MGEGEDIPLKHGEAVEHPVVRLGPGRVETVGGCHGRQLAVGDRARTLTATPELVEEGEDVKL